MKIVAKCYLFLLIFVAIVKANSNIVAAKNEPSDQMERKLSTITDSPTHKHHHKKQHKNRQQNLVNRQHRALRNYDDIPESESEDEEESSSSWSESSTSESGSSTSEAGSNEETTPEICFEDFNDMEHLRNYKRISNDMKFYEDEYSVCIKEIPDTEYTEQGLDECLGKNFLKVTLDLKYIILKVMSKADEKIRKIFVNDCYSPAGTIEEYSNSCDLMERDILDLLWNGFDFLNLIDLNKSKYLEDYGALPENSYETMFEQFTKLSNEFFELLDELDSHKEITILRLKTLIDDRTKLILEDAETHGPDVEPATIQHRIEIVEKLETDDGAGIEFLPTDESQHGSDRRRSRRLELKEEKDEKTVKDVKKSTKNQLPSFRLQENIDQKQSETEFKNSNPRNLELNDKNDEKINSIRTLNSGLSYTQLNGSNRNINGLSRNRFAKNEELKNSIIDKFGKPSRFGKSTSFKNIHTPHYSQKKMKE